MSTTEIECRCGAVHLELSEKPLAQFFCHCDDCQAAHGAAYVPLSLYRAGAVTITRGNPSAWKLKTTPRVTCTDCGTRLFAEVTGLTWRSVMGDLLPRGQFTPAFHIFCRFAVRPIKDDLPHFRGVPARFGGSDDTVGW